MLDHAHLDRIARSVQDGLRRHRSFSPGNDDSRPDRASVRDLCQRLLSLLFPGYFSGDVFRSEHVETYTQQQLIELEIGFARQIAKALHFHRRCRGDAVDADLRPEAARITVAFLERLSHVAAMVSTDVDAALANDPAAASREEILVSYPCIEAISIQRAAHELYHLGVPLLPRMMTETAHSHTGIDIHPGAHLGESFFIDHGTGVVIGETCEIGDHCVLYHSVTLGAFNPLAKNEAGELVRGQNNKRHPTLESHVVVYPGATILGGTTVIGHHSVIGGNAWLTRSVEPYTLVLLKDPELVLRSRQRS